MSVLKLFTGLVIAMAAGWGFYQRSRDEGRSEMPKRKPGRKTAFVEPLLLPFCLAALFIMAIITNGVSYTGAMMARLCVILFLYISIYYAGLLCLLPVLRRYISARACATLWLLPNLLYLTIYIADSATPPLIVITLPRQWLTVFTRAWLGGFACVLLWQFASHFRCRRFLLQNAALATDEAVLSLWSCQQVKHEVKASIPILTSETITTPVTVGCFDRTMRLILPRHNYTQDELTLIFQHELRHIQRLDIRTKVFLGFCTAMCWFNPLVWIARRKVSDDLELSCDEAVLADAGELTRKRYAELLLKTAGSSKGYTTCLSAAAGSLRYRLKNVINPRKRSAGSVVIGMATLTLIMGFGTIALTDSGGTVETLIFDKAPAGNSVDRVVTNNWDDERLGYSGVYGWDERALTSYIASLQVKQVYVGNYSDEGLRQLYVDYGIKEADETVSLTRMELYEGGLRANIPYDDYGDLVYLLEKEIDWDYLESLLDFDAVNPDPAPFPPEMTMYFNDEINADGQLMHASKTVLSIESGGEKQEVNEDLNDVGTGGVQGYPLTQVRLYFSEEPSGIYRVKVENWERTESYFVSSDQLAENVLPLAPYSAHYTVYGSFATVRETVDEMKFSFDIVLPEE